MSKIIGIDLGTTNSVVAVLDSGEPKVMTNEEGARITPSVVGFAESGEVLVGEIARRQAIMNPEATISSIKRFMGRRMSEVEGELERFAYHIVANERGDVEVEVRGRHYRPEEISARVLQKLKRSAELYLGEPVNAAVITVPAYFNDAQRKATRDAGEIAGLEVKRIINEPTAAALAYGLDKNVDEIIAVYDFGGGTLDISILEVGKDVVEVLATHGDTHLGGDNIDARIVSFLIEQFESETGIDVRGDRVVLQRLREAAERAKIELSSILEADINLPFLTADASGPRHLNVRLARARLEQMIADLVDRSLECCKLALEDAGKTASGIDEVLLVGGTTRIPMIQRRVGEFFGREPHRGVNPDEVVALGAAVQGGVLGGEIDNILLLDVTPLSLGVEAQGGVMVPIITRNTTIPTRRTRMFSTVTDNQSRVEVKVYQGERDFVQDNRLLGKVSLDDIPSAPRATPQIEVAFDIDANGILSVSAQELTTQKAASITIKDTGGLTAEEIQRAVQQAAAHESTDRERRQVVEQRNRLTRLIFATERKLYDAPELEPELRARVEAAIQEARDADDREEGDPETLHTLLETLKDAAAALSDAILRVEEPEAAAEPVEDDEPSTDEEDEAAAESETH